MMTRISVQSELEIAEVAKDSPAAKAGLQSGEVIVTLDGDGCAISRSFRPTEWPPVGAANRFANQGEDGHSRDRGQIGKQAAGGQLTVKCALLFLMPIAAVLARAESPATTPIDARKIAAASVIQIDKPDGSRLPKVCLVSPDGYFLTKASEVPNSRRHGSPSRRECGEDPRSAPRLALRSRALSVFECLRPRGREVE